VASVGRWLRAHTSSSLSWAGRRVDGGIGGQADGDLSGLAAATCVQTSALARRAGGRRTRLSEQTAASAWLANRGLI
jgi:hypothetical protein